MAIREPLTVAQQVGTRGLIVHGSVAENRRELLESNEKKWWAR